MPKRPQEHHLRRAYALADLYERAGDVARARELFSRLVAVDPDFADARSRLRHVG
jgi:lipopolysaccharide biosynthesis regulator YciM